MSVQTLCKTPEDLAKFSVKEFENKFFKSVKKLAKKHFSLDTAAPCYLSLEEKLMDIDKTFLLLFGKFSKWRNYAKQKAKTSLALYGCCFITSCEESNALIINIVPAIGKIKKKEDLIAKHLKKMISISRCKIKILDLPLSEEQLNKLEAKTEAMEETIDSGENEETTGKTDNNFTENTPQNTNTDNNNTDEKEEIAGKELTPTQAQKIESIKADIAAIKELLSKINSCESLEELGDLDKQVKEKFAPYASKKSS